MGYVITTVLVIKAAKELKSELKGAKNGETGKITAGEGGSKSIPDLSNKAVKHSMNDHMPARYAKQLQYYTYDELFKLLGGK